MMRLPRRRFVQGSFAAGSLGMGGLLGLAARRGRSQDTTPAPAEKLLFVVCAAGGGSILDSFLPVADTEVSAPDLAQTLSVQPSSLVRQPNGSNIRCVGNRGGTVAELPAGYPISQDLFLERHAADTVVMTLEGTSVNHRVAQKRSLTGAGADRGRTILEAVAERHGSGFLLPQVNMATDGYLEPGDDPSLPLYARGEPVADALLFPFQTHGSRGLGTELEVSASRLARVRGIRDELDDLSPFGRTYRDAPRRQRYLERRAALDEMEARNLIDEVMMVPDDGLRFPLSAYGLSTSPAAAEVQAVFEQLVNDGFEAQAALAFLLARAGVGAAFALAPSFQPTFRGATIVNTPLAFDFSHADHAGTQNVMWSRVLAVVDGLIRLLKGSPVGETGETLWDRSLVYIATDFGRDKVKPYGSSQWGTAHHLNNGVVMISPLLRGNRVYGGVDPDTCLTYGFDPTTGDPAPGTVMREADVYSVLAGALDVPFEGRRDFPAVVKS